MAYLSSQALGRRVALYKTCLRMGHKLRLSGVDEEVRRVMSVMRLESIFSLCESLEAALEPA